jgi:hypothetical protein
MAARRTTTRETKMTSRKVEAQADGSAPKGGMTMVDGMAIVTTLVMIAAILLVDYNLGHQFSKGMFFKP